MYLKLCFDYCNITKSWFLDCFLDKIVQKLSPRVFTCSDDYFFGCLWSWFLFSFLSWFQKYNSFFDWFILSRDMGSDWSRTNFENKSYGACKNLKIVSTIEKWSIFGVNDFENQLGSVSGNFDSYFISKLSFWLIRISTVSLLINTL